MVQLRRYRESCILVHVGSLFSGPNMQPCIIEVAFYD